MKNERIKTLEALRGIAFFAVAVHHIGNPRLFIVAGGAWAVSIFFILSGFVEVLSRFDKPTIEPNIKNNFKYAISKIKKIYPLHLITALSFVVFDFVGEQTESILSTLYKTVVNALLIQEWPPFRVRSMNGPSWYLCTLLLFYFVSPKVLKTIKNNYTSKKAIKNIAIIFVIQIAIGIIGYLIPNPEYSKEMLLEYDITYWFVYRFPLSRLLDVLLGCNLAYLYLNNKNRIIKNVNIKETIMLTLTIVVLILYFKTMDPVIFKPEIPFVNKNKWWTYSILFTPTSLLTVWLFAYGQGKTTRALTNNTTLFLARISASGFLIHTVVYRYISSIILFVIGTNRAETIMFKYGSYINLTLGIVLTIVCCLIWERIVIGFKHIKQKTRKNISF